MNISKKIISIVYILVLVAMGTATIVEKYNGTDYVKEQFYGAWWFTLLWAILTALGVFYFIKRKVKTPSIFALHLSFVIILLGAFLTHVTSRQGVVHLRLGETVDKYLTPADTPEGVEEHALPFSIRLNKFDIIYHNGTTAVADYVTRFTVNDNGQESEGEVSMNNIYSHRGIRLYQSSYDNDMRGSILSMNNDPWGIPVTYTGYALLFISLVWMLFDPRGSYRRLLRSKLLKKGALTLTALLLLSAPARALNALPQATADKFGRLNILYNDRICPLQTFAIDFTKKLCGKASYNGYTAEQVVTGFIFYGSEWSGEPIIKLKGGELKETLQLPDRCSVNTFFNQTMGGYTIGPYVQEYYQGQQDAFHKQAADIDDRLQLVMELRRGNLLKIFPYTEKTGNVIWHAPTDKFDSTINKEQALYMQNVFSVLNEYVMAGDMDKVNETIDKMSTYQQKYGGNSLPSETQVKAERIYNEIPFATILFMLNLTMGVATLALTIYRLTGRKGGEVRWTAGVNRCSLAVMALSWTALTVCLALRWMVSGKIPMANGYETMLFVAWLVMFTAMVAYRRFKIALTFGFLMSGFFLLVSHIGQMDPAIGRVMPVLNSPLLSVHVSIIMTAFALLSLTFICGVTALVLEWMNKDHNRLQVQLESLQLLSRLLLYPALMFLGIGIFVGAIWANVSWGKYWGWDPKEVWALITMMVYCIAAHTASLPPMRRPTIYHTFMVFAFLTILMTYFGVNYFLGGMHSYA